MNQGIADNDKDYYSRYVGRAPKFYRYILSAIIQHSSPGPILDVGCGTGLFLEHCREWGIKAVGLEGASVKNPRVKIVKHNLSEAFPFEPASFQTIVINQVIQYLEPTTLLNVLQESRRVLKSEGALLIYSPSAASRFQDKSKTVKVTKLFSPSQLKKLLEDYGFTNILLQYNPLRFGLTNSIIDAVIYTMAKYLKLEFLSATSDAIAYKA